MASPERTLRSPCPQPPIPSVPLTREKPLHLLSGAGPGQPPHFHHISLAALRVQHHIGGQVGLRLGLCGSWRKPKHTL